MIPSRMSDHAAGQVFFRVRLFLSAYTLLFALLSIRFDQPWLRITCGVLALIGAEEAVRLVFVTPRHRNAYTYTVDSVDDAGGMVSGFLAGHLLPFLAPGSPTNRDLVAYLIFFLVLLLVSVNSDLAHVNPMLYLLGRKVGRITADSYTGTLVAADLPRAGDVVSAVRLPGGLIQVAREDGDDSPAPVG